MFLSHTSAYYVRLVVRCIFAFAGYMYVTYILSTNVCSTSKWIDKGGLFLQKEES